MWPAVNHRARTACAFALAARTRDTGSGGRHRNQQHGRHVGQHRRHRGKGWRRGQTQPGGQHGGTSSPPADPGNVVAFSEMLELIRQLRTYLRREPRRARHRARTASAPDARKGAPSRPHRVTQAEPAAYAAGFLLVYYYHYNYSIPRSLLRSLFPSVFVRRIPALDLP